MSSLREAVLSGQHVGTALKSYGLRGRGVVHVEDGTLIQVIDRSSRVLRKDAERFLQILHAVSEIEGHSLEGELLVRRAPICSKASAWLNEMGVHVASV